MPTFVNSFPFQQFGRCSVSPFIPSPSDQGKSLGQEEKADWLSQSDLQINEHIYFFFHRDSWHSFVCNRVFCLHFPKQAGMQAWRPETGYSRSPSLLLLIINLAWDRMRSNCMKRVSGSDKYAALFFWSELEEGKRNRCKKNPAKSDVLACLYGKGTSFELLSW